MAWELLLVSNVNSNGKIKFLTCFAKLNCICIGYLIIVYGII